MREFKIVFVFVCFLSLLGCAVSKVDATKMDVSAIQFSERLVKEMSNKLDKLVTPLRAQKLETQQYKVYHNNFFPSPAVRKGCERVWPPIAQWLVAASVMVPAKMPKKISSFMRG